MTKPYTWDEIKKLLSKELEKTKHMLTFGTIGSCDVENDVDIIITKKPKSKSSAEILTKNIDVIDLFENTIKKINKNLSTRWITEELFSVLNYNKKELEEIDLNHKHFIELLKLIEENKISELKAKEILRSWKEKSFSPLKEIGKHRQISGKGEMGKIVKEIIQKKQASRRGLQIWKRMGYKLSHRKSYEKNK